MRKITEVKALKNFRIWVKFADGAEGTADLSELKGKGVFSSWDDIDVFNSVFVNKESNTVSWPGGIDLCPDVLYAEIIGKDITSVLKSGVKA